MIIVVHLVRRDKTAVGDAFGPESKKLAKLLLIWRGYLNSKLDSATGDVII